MGWDVTAAATAHATLAGVLAGLALAILTMLANRPEPSPMLGKEPAPTHSITFRFLLLSVFFLIVSAVIWGGLAGQPSLIKAASTEKQMTLSALNGSVGAAAVILLSLGALCMIAGIVEMVAHAKDLREFVVRSYALLAPLAVFEILLFVTDPMPQIFGGGFFKKDFWAYLPHALSLIVLILCIGIAMVPSDRFAHWPPHLAETDDASRWAVISAAASAALSVLAYALPPGRTPETDLSITSIDRVDLVLLLLSALCATLFVLSSTLMLRSEETVVEGEMKPQDN